MKLLKLKLDDLGKIGRGKSKHRPRDDKSLYGGDYPFVQTGDVKAANFYLTEFTQTYNEKGLAQSKLWKKGTLLITIAANIGDTAILGIDACFPDSIVGFQSYENVSDIKYVKYYLDYIKLELKAISAGTTQDNMSLEKLLSRNLYVHEYSNQVKIANILSSYDELIENNKQRIKLLEEMAEEIYKEWFVRLRFPGYENTKIVDGLPDGWETVSLGKTFDISLGGTPSRENENYWNGNIPWINSGKVNDLRIIEASEYITELGLKKSATKILPKKTTLLAITGATLGQVSLLEIDACTNQSVIGIKDPLNKIDEFIFLSMKKEIKNLINYAGGGAQQHINKAIVEDASILMPNEEILKKFISIVKPQFDLISNLMFKNQLLQETRDLLLPRLISGKLSVEHLVEKEEALAMVAEPRAEYK